MFNTINNSYTAEKATRDMNPTAPAIVAMNLYNERYAKEGKGSMGFWDSLNEHEKNLCIKTAEEIREAEMEE